MTDEQRLPTREQIANLRQPVPPPTCSLCFEPRDEEFENGVCSECRRELGKRGMELIAENARLREAIGGALAWLSEDDQDKGVRGAIQTLADALRWVKSRSGGRDG